MILKKSSYVNWTKNILYNKYIDLALLFIVPESFLVLFRWCSVLSYWKELIPSNSAANVYKTHSYGNHCWHLLNGLLARLFDYTGSSTVKGTVKIRQCSQFAQITHDTTVWNQKEKQISVTTRFIIQHLDKIFLLKANREKLFRTFRVMKV